MFSFAFNMLKLNVDLFNFDSLIQSVLKLSIYVQKLGQISKIVNSVA